MIITGIERSGMSLLSALLFCTVRNKEVFLEGTSTEGRDDGAIVKIGRLLRLVEPPKKPVIMIRDPRAVLTCKVGGEYCANPEGVLMNCEIASLYTAQSLFRYEHLVKRPDQFQDLLGQYWGLQYWEEFSTWPIFAGDKIEQIRAAYGDSMIRKIDAGHDWRDHLPEIRRHFDAFPLLHRHVIDLGYEKDTGWYDEVLEKTQQKPVTKRYTARPKSVTIGFGVIK